MLTACAAAAHRSRPALPAPGLFRTVQPPNRPPRRSGSRRAVRATSCSRLWPKHPHSPSATLAPQAASDPTPGMAPSPPRGPATSAARVTGTPTATLLDLPDEVLRIIFGSCWQAERHVPLLCSCRRLSTVGYSAIDRLSVCPSGDVGADYPTTRNFCSAPGPSAAPSVASAVQRQKHPDMKKSASLCLAAL